ncbi:MAG TPA: ABC transporter substrate-binding protein [Chloroflexota bacterium]|nr:ABC transporter substrate-binding protein [Chloroflexota bacterium]
MLSAFRVASSVMVVTLALAACTPAPPAPAAAPAVAEAQPPAERAVPAAAQPTAPPSLRKIRVDYASYSAVYAPHFIAADKGYYAEEGLEMEMVEAPGTTGIAAVLAGETQFTTSASSSLSAILSGSPMKIIYTNADRPGYELWSSGPEIRALPDVSGKSVGIAGRGDTMEISTRLLLAQHGLDPDGVTFAALGFGSGRLAAVESGAVAAAILGIADVERLRQDGPKGVRLADAAREVKMLYTGVATGDKLIADDAPLVRAFLRATVKGREYAKRYKDETLEILGKYNGLPRDVNEPDYDSTLTTMTEDGTLAPDVQAADARVRAELIGVPADRPTSEMYDYRFVKDAYAELQQRGWQPAR